MTSKEIMELQQEVMTEIIECQEREIKLLKEKAEMWYFLIGLFIGFIAGVAAVALFSANGD